MAPKSNRYRKAASRGKNKSDAKHGMTPTQLHNARKRRAKQKKREQQPQQGGDPSAQYLKNPKAAPLVQAAIAFFQDRLDTFPVYQKGPKEGWRTVSKLPVRRHQGKVVVGLFQPHSHKVAAQTYPAHHPSINMAMKIVQAACQEMGMEVYNEQEGTGHLRYVALNVERATGQIQMTLIWNDAPYAELTVPCQKKKKTKKKKNNNNNAHQRGIAKAQLERLLSLLLKLGTAGEETSSFPLHSLWVHYNNAWKHSNAIFDITSPNTWQHVHGPKTIPEQLDLPNAPTLQFAPNVFRQANLDAFAHIIAAIRKRMQTLTARPTSCLELYGGVGTIGLHLTDLVESLICSDENPHNQACFEAASRELLIGDKKKKNLQYVPHNATEMVQKGYLKKAQVVIVDPPRKGLDEVVLDGLVDGSSGIQLLVYVSCGFEAFQRDCQRLTESGKWKLEHAEGHILFPGANAIETLAYFVPCK